MIGFNGGLIGGFRDTAGLASVPGVWTANEQVAARRRGAWPGNPDPFFSSVSLLLPGDGANGSTSIIDRSPSPKTITVVGNAQISTAQSKFGGSSIAFDGNGDRIQSSPNQDRNFGTGDFTIEFWVYFNSLSSIAGLLGEVPGASAITTISIFADANRAFNVTLLGTNVQMSTSSNVAAVSIWQHVALVRASNQCNLYIDGTSRSQFTTTASIQAGNSLGLAVGTALGTGELNGYIDDLRITKGVARYTSNFTPPTTPHPLF